MEGADKLNQHLSCTLLCCDLCSSGHFFVIHESSKLWCKGLRLVVALQQFPGSCASALKVLCSVQLPFHRPISLMLHQNTKEVLLIMLLIDLTSPVGDVLESLSLLVHELLQVVHHLPSLRF